MEVVYCIKTFHPYESFLKAIVSINSNNSVFLSRSLDYLLQIVKVKTGKKIASLRDNNQYSTRFIFSNDSKFIAAESIDPGFSVTLWSFSNNKLIRVLHTQSTSALYWLYKGIEMTKNSNIILFSLLDYSVII